MHPQELCNTLPELPEDYYRNKPQSSEYLILKFSFSALKTMVLIYVSKGKPVTNMST